MTEFDDAVRLLRIHGGKITNFSHSEIGILKSHKLIKIESKYYTLTPLGISKLQEAWVK